MGSDKAASRCEHYVNYVLRPGFEEAKAHFFEPMMAINQAHAIMLSEQGIIDERLANEILRALDKIKRLGVAEEVYNERFEDLFFLVEEKLEAELGAERASNLHLGRSRNDMDTTMYRMVIRRRILNTLGLVLALAGTLYEFAAKHVNTVMPGYTHDQQAQPTTMAHYAIAVGDNLLRDAERLTGAYARVNLSPMGAAAFATTGFPIDRRRMAELLGFDGLVENSYDGIAASDCFGEVASDLLICGSTLNRFVTDLLLWASNEFSSVRVADQYVQISSIMPQKRNPVVLEHIRAMLGKLFGHVQTVFALMHNTPFGDIVDTGDDLQPPLYRSFDALDQVLTLLAKVVETLEVNTELLLARAREGYSAVTELADAIVREKGVPFRAAHRIVSALVTEGLRRGTRLIDLTPESLDKAAIDVTGKPLGLSPEVFHQAIDPVRFVMVRDRVGGPAPSETTRMLAERTTSLAGWRETRDRLASRLEAAERQRLAVVRMNIERKEVR
ncbi:MAG TPA: argininosuccinate lyase [Firmicutes bacterium]|nr:argininosuccinate lyase [Bacillota bacterium]